LLTLNNPYSTSATEISCREEPCYCRKKKGLIDKKKGADIIGLQVKPKITIIMNFP